MANQLSAYELAEKAQGLAYEIPADWSSGEPKNVATDIAAMLRQQADRIAELEETIGACYAVQKMQAEEVYKGNDRIAELEKLLEHSVGSDCREIRYIQEIENKDARIAELEKFNKAILKKGGYPHKPLSDEEIEQIAKQHLAAYAQFIGAGEVCYEGEIEFARAIEERHGIK